MKVIYGSAFIDEVQKIGTIIKTKIVQASAFLANLFYIRNTDCGISKLNAISHNKEYDSPLLSKKPESFLAANQTAHKSLTNITPVMNELQLNPEVAGTISRHDGKTVGANKEPSPVPFSGSEARPKSQLQAKPLLPRIAVKDPVATNPTKKRRAPLPPLSPDLIDKLVQTIKSGPSDDIGLEKKRAPARPPQPTADAKLKMALKDFSVNREMAKDKWGLSIDKYTKYGS